MNSILPYLGDTGPKGFACNVCLDTPTREVEDQFATTPMSVFRPLPSHCQQPNEEELHTSFEQAISDRVLAVNQRLSRLSGSLHPLALSQETPIPPTMAPLPERDDCFSAPSVPTGIQQSRSKGWFGKRWQRNTIFIGFVLSLMLVGFDLMGLLVLSTR